MSDAAICMENVSKRYGRVQALRGLSLRVEPGEIFGFLGPNGAGKTTTIRCLLDLIRPEEGRITILGVDPRRSPAEARELTGYLPGELNLDDNLTVAGALRFFIRLRRPRADWNTAQAMAERLGLDLGKQLKNLSKGNKQKVGLVQALMHRPPVLLLDEPTGGLDPLVQQTVLEMVSEARDQGATVFFSSHILSEVQAIAGRVGIIRAGRLVEVAHTADLLQRSVRRVSLRFAAAVDPGALLALEGVTLVDQPSPESLRLQVVGPVDALVKALAAYPLQDLDTERPSLEDVFLAYYRDPGDPGGK